MDIEAEDEMTFRAIALACAAMSWSGISAIRDRDQSVLSTAKKFEQYLKEGLE